MLSWSRSVEFCGQVVNDYDFVIPFVIVLWDNESKTSIIKNGFQICFLYKDLI